MEYRKEIRSTNTVRAWYNQGINNFEVELKIGERYKVSFIKPTTKKDRNNNGRTIEVLGFTDSFMGDVIVRYLDNNRRGRLPVNCLLPYEIQL